MSLTQAERKAKGIKKAAAKRSKTMRQRPASELRDELRNLGARFHFAVGGQNSEVIGRILTHLARFVGSTHPCAWARQHTDIPGHLDSIWRDLLAMRDLDQYGRNMLVSIDQDGLRKLSEAVAKQEARERQTRAWIARNEATSLPTTAPTGEPSEDEEIATQLLAKFSKKAAQ